jgi:phosphatidylglycerophosphate synthase
MPANASFDKGRAVEEWTDLRFFRPAGLRIARALMPTRLSPDHVTMLALVVGLVAGRLCYYDNVGLNALGVVLFIVSDIFDSADGQLARMRGTSSRLGKVLDGIADGARFTNLYVQLMARLLVAGAPWWMVVPLGVAAGIAHAKQSAAADYIRQLYLYLAEGGAGEFALAEDMPAMSASTRRQVYLNRFYAGYLRSHARLVPRSLALVRRLRATNTVRGIDRAWADSQAPVVRQCAWIGQNIRFLLLAITVVPGHPAAFLWITLVPMSAVMMAILAVHERHAAALLDPGSPRLAEAA